MGFFVVVILGEVELNLKKLVKVLGNKKVEMFYLKDLEVMIGYICGGCLFIGMKKLFFIYLD